MACAQVSHRHFLRKNVDSCTDRCNRKLLQHLLVMMKLYFKHNGMIADRETHPVCGSTRTKTWPSLSLSSETPPAMSVG